MNLILMGPPGSGKTTQGEILAQKLNLPHIETGETYRKLSEQNTDLGKQIKSALASGSLVDDKITFEVVDKGIAEIETGFVLEGFPRTLVQAERELFPVDQVLNIHITDELATKRLLSRKRQDDTPDIIARRLRIYHERTEPILQYYRKSGKLTEIDGSGSVDEVSREIESKIMTQNG